MRKVTILCLVLSIMFVTTVIAQTADKTTKDAYRLQIGQKAERGVKNAAFGWTEIPKRIVDLTKETNPIWGLLAGTAQGTCNAFARTVSGVVDVLTCGVKSDEDPFIQPVMNVVPKNSK